MWPALPPALGDEGSLEEASGELARGHGSKKTGPGPAPRRPQQYRTTTESRPITFLRQHSRAGHISMVVGEGGGASSSDLQSLLCSLLAVPLGKLAREVRESSVLEKFNLIQGFSPCPGHSVPQIKDTQQPLYLQ